MRLSELISEIGYDLDRTSIDDQVKFWVQQAIDTVYAALPKKERQRSVTITAATGVQEVNAPSDFGDFDTIYDSDKEPLAYLTPREFFAPDKNLASGGPIEFTYWNNQILFSPIPDAGTSYTFNYFLEKPNVYVHDLTMSHYASMVAHVQVYIDEDGVAEGEGKLLFVSPTSADAKIQLQTADGHRHEVIVYHDVDAATKGAPWYFDENATNAYERNFYLSPTLSDTVIRTANTRRHHHYLNFIHNPDPTSHPDGNNVAVYVDEDGLDRSLRFGYISPTTTATVANELIQDVDNVVPGLIELYHSSVFEFAMAKGHRFNKRYDRAAAHEAAAGVLMAFILGNPANATSTVSNQTDD